MLASVLAFARDLACLGDPGFDMEGDLGCDVDGEGGGKISPDFNTG